MGGEGSGRRALTATTAVLPELGSTELEIGEFVDAVAVGVASEAIDPRVADTLKDLARTKLAALRQNSERRRIDELKAIIADAHRLRADGLQHTQRVRQHRAEPTPGVWDRDAWRAAAVSVGRSGAPRRPDGEDDAED